MNVIEIKYTCPVHQEIQGKLNDKCSECGMMLTIVVPESGEKQNLNNYEKRNHK